MITGADNGSTQLSSDRCDGEPEFMKWLFSHKRSPQRNRGQQDRPRRLNRGAGVPQEIIDAYEARVFEGMPYRLLLPADFEAARKYPLILNLHGGGGVGNDNRSNLRDWSAKFVDPAWRAKYPCIVVTPQAAGSWSITGEIVPVLTEARKKTYSQAWQARIEKRNYPPGPMSDGPLTRAFALIDHLGEEFRTKQRRALGACVVAADGKRKRAVAHGLPVKREALDDGVGVAVHHLVGGVFLRPEHAEPFVE